MMRCAIYSRFSSQLQNETSSEDQARLCRERILRENWNAVAAFEDRALSGASMLRPGLQALMTAARSGEFDVLVAEALDRLSRDQADVATIYKQLSFDGVRIITLAEGEISELHVGLKGTMNQLFLRDLADKTRRGLRGRVEAGLSGGGLSYGYDVVKRVVNDEPVRGERRINAAEAAVVRRIFAEFADGHSPKAIAKRLNTEGIKGPRGALWRDTAIRGHRQRGTGLLNNELYAGRMVWNRLRYIKDPATGKRVSRQNPPEAWITTDVSELRIVDDPLWDRVKARQEELDRQPRVQAIKASWFRERRRAVHLLTGLVNCAACGGPLAAVGRDYLACSAARKLDTCSNRKSIKRSVLEESVLSLLRTRLMEPDAVAAFIAAYSDAVNAQRREEVGDRARLEAEAAKLTRQLNGLYDAIADGLRTPGLKARLEEAEARHAVLEAKLRQPEAPSVRLHPNLAELYRRKVSALAESLADPEIRTPALEAIRELIDKVRVDCSGDSPSIELKGALACMIERAQPGVAGLLDRCSVEVVAGTGFEPVTFRL